jgi:hypothetical protein
VQRPVYRLIDRAVDVRLVRRRRLEGGAQRGQCRGVLVRCVPIERIAQARRLGQLFFARRRERIVERKLDQALVDAGVELAGAQCRFERPQ